MNLQISQRTGFLAECLGVDGKLKEILDSYVENLLSEGLNELDVIEQVHKNMDLTDTQFCAFVYALGYYAGANNL